MADNTLYEGSQIGDNRMNIAIAGPQCAGKTTVANYLQARIPQSKIIKFAKPIYDVNIALDVGKDRKWMQDFSTMAKLHFGRDIFLELFKKQVEAEAGFHPILINDDARFEMEAKFLVATGWKLIYVDANTNIREYRAAFQGLDFITDHESEQELDKVWQLATDGFQNDRTLDDLERTVLKFIRRLS